jgi:biofilm PGA synthesis N-glycosyltransferase PgaC
MVILEWLFWISLFIVFYSYLGYGILLYAILFIRRRFRKIDPEADSPYEPAVSLVIAAFNEEAFIRKKIENTLDLDYPQDKLKIIFVTDGSSDATPGITAGYSRIRHLHEAERRGKSAAINRAMHFVDTPIVVFCDANTLLNRECIRELVKFYRDPAVGGVAGEKKVLSMNKEGAVAGEGIYWKYESALKKMDAELYTVVGAAGELFSLRTDLYEELPAHILLDDFVLSMQICRKGFRVQYEPRAFAMEEASADMKEEQKRKVRISAGGFQSILLLRDLLNPFRYPLLSFQFLSHRVLRWTICPLCLLILLFTNVLLAVRTNASVYIFLLAAQGLFYLLAGTGWILASRGSGWKLLYVPYYLLFMNVSVFLGFFRFIRGRQTVLWEKARRVGDGKVME